MTQTQDLEMAARQGNGAAGGAYYPPPRAGAGGEDLDDDGRKKRTGKRTNIRSPTHPPQRGAFSHLCLSPVSSALWWETIR
jgi:hypothetical protein